MTVIASQDAGPTDAPLLTMTIGANLAATVAAVLRADSSRSRASRAAAYRSTDRSLTSS